MFSATDRAALNLFPLDPIAANEVPPHPQLGFCTTFEWTKEVKFVPATAGHAEVRVCHVSLRFSVCRY